MPRAAKLHTHTRLAMLKLNLRDALALARASEFKQT